MFEKNKKNQDSDDGSMGVFRPAKGSAKVIIGNGVTLKGDITQADEVQIDGNADVTMKTDNLIVGATGKTKGTIEAHNADIWGEADGDIKVSGTLTIQEAGSVNEIKPRTDNVMAESQTARVQAPDNGVISDEQLAASYRSQADAMFKEAKRLREQAEELVPTKQKSKASAEAAS